MRHVTAKSFHQPSCTDQPVRLRSPLGGSWAPWDHVVRSQGSSLPTCCSAFWGSLGNTEGGLGIPKRCSETARGASGMLAQSPPCRSRRTRQVGETLAPVPLGTPGTGFSLCTPSQNPPYPWGHRLPLAQLGTGGPQGNPSSPLTLGRPSPCLQRAGAPYTAGWKRGMLGLQYLSRRWRLRAQKSS